MTILFVTAGIQYDIPPNLKIYAMYCPLKNRPRGICPHQNLGKKPERKHTKRDLAQYRPQQPAYRNGHLNSQCNSY